jgi:hypothetical protein
MVKKKKNRHQQEPTTQNGGDSTESCDENQPNNTGEHIMFVRCNYTLAICVCHNYVRWYMQSIVPQSAL